MQVYLPKDLSRVITDAPLLAIPAELRDLRRLYLYVCSALNQATAISKGKPQLLNVGEYNRILSILDEAFNRVSSPKLSLDWPFFVNKYGSPEGVYEAYLRNALPPNEITEFEDKFLVFNRIFARALVKIYRDSEGV